MCDRDQPVVRSQWLLAALQGPEGVEERRLRDVLGVGLVPQDAEGVAVDVGRMAAVEPLEGPVHVRLLPQKGRHVKCDTRNGGNLRAAEGSMPGARNRAAVS